MKTQIIFFLASLFPFLASASHYPPDYCHQSVRTSAEGPALFAHVGSGCFSANVFGYKNTGYLAQFRPEAIDAIIIGQCQLRDGSIVSKKSVVRLGKEWHQTGYLSSPQSSYVFLPDACYYQGDSAAARIPYQVAFSDGQGHWDSKEGRNYLLPSLFLETSPAVRTHTDGQAINIPAWEIIVGEMRR